MTKSVVKKNLSEAKKHSVAFKYLDALVASEMEVFYAAYNYAPVKSAKKATAKKTTRKAARA